MTTGEPANALLMRLEGPAPAMQVAKDLARRTIWVAPALLVLATGIWGVDGAASAAYGIAIVIANFLLSAWLLEVGGRISFAAMAGAAMFGYVLRLGLITVAVLLVKDASWVNIVALGLTLIVTHLGLLFWELRYVSGSYAYPGLKPGVVSSPSADRPGDGGLIGSKER